jgi:hypothetical protein
MKKILIGLVLALAACSNELPENGKDGASCTVSESEEGATIACEDGTQVFLPNGEDGDDGTNGSNGEDGLNGSDARSCIVSDFDGFTCLECPDAPFVCFDHAEFCGENAHVAADLGNSCYCDGGYILVGQDCVPDICTANNWYRDGECDTFCPSLDPDCL